MGEEPFRLSFNDLLAQMTVLSGAETSRNCRLEKLGLV
jgi:hypothetical protein